MATITTTSLTYARPTPSLKTLGYLASEARPGVQGIFLLRLLSVGVPVSSSLLPTLAAASGWLCVTVAIYLLNGLSDLSGDRLNGSCRPLATSRLEMRTAQIAALGSGVAGLTICLSHSVALGGLALCMMLLGAGYSFGPCWKGNHRAAGAVIGAGAALTYAAGAVAGGSMEWSTVAFTTSVSLWIAAACATKDLSDVVGDMAMGRRTAPIELGEALARRNLTLATALTSLVVSAVSLALGVHAFAALAIAAGTALLGQALRYQERAVWSRPRTPYRVYMVTQYVACAGLAAGLAT